MSTNESNPDDENHQDNVVKRSVPTERVGGSAKGVRLKRSRRSKSGESATGTGQFKRKGNIMGPIPPSNYKNTNIISLNL